MTGSTYTPNTWQDLQVSNVIFSSFGTTGQATANTTTNLDYTLNDDIFIQAIEIIAREAVFGDKITITIRSSGGATVATIVQDYNVSVNFDKFLIYESAVPYKALGTMVIRVAYTSTSPSVPVDLAINCISLQPTL